MKSNSQGLQDSFKRAFNAIVRANLQSMLGAPNAPFTNPSPQTWGYLPTAQMPMASITGAINSAIGEAQNAVLSPSYLRLEQPIVTTANSILFPILDNATTNSNAQRATEKRLTQQDSFFASSMQVFLVLGQSAIDTALRLETFPNVNIFPTGAAGLETVAPLNTFYNGIMEITINKNVIVPSYPLSDFMQIPQTQRISTTAALQSNQLDPTEVALLEPNLNFIGSKSNSIKLIFPSNISAVDNFTYAVIIFRGTLGQNTTILT
jgi:hypothetical protein